MPLPVCVVLLRSKLKFIIFSDVKVSKIKQSTSKSRRKECGCVGVCSSVWTPVDDGRVRERVKLLEHIYVCFVPIKPLDCVQQLNQWSKAIAETTMFSMTI